MYQSLYRKYRPSDFQNVYGQTITKKILINSIKNNKISHAYLFFGPRGTGKTSIAKMYARICNCLNNENGECCEKCENCVESMNKNCVDIIEIDAASNNGVDEIRELKNKISLVPNKLKYKVYIIDEVHMLSTGAFNALLKTLEEPPEHVIFILATTDYYKVPSTIISRCQTIEFKNIDDENMHKRLEEISNNENIIISSDAIDEIVKNSNGGLRDAIGILEKVNAYVDVDEIKQKSMSITSDDVREIIGNVSCDEIKKIVECIIEEKIQLLVDRVNNYAQTGKDLLKIIDDIIRQMLDLIFYENKYELIDKVKIANKYYNEMKKSNNQKILFEIMIIEMYNNTNVRKNISREIIDDKKSFPSYEKNLNENKTKTSIKPVVEESFINNRVNNCFACANKQKLIEIKNIWNDLKKYVFDSEVGSYICDLLDCVPIVAGDKNIMLCSEYESVVDKINQNLALYENVLFDKINLSQKIVTVSKLKWTSLKDIYLKKIKNGDRFEYIEETTTVEKKIENNNNDIEQKAKELFGEIFN